MSSNRPFAAVLGKTRIYAFTAVCAAFFLASCASTGGLSGAAELVHTSSRVQGNYRTVECEIGEVTRTYTVQASVDYGVETVYFTGNDIGTLKEMHVYNRQTVSKGDLLAEIELDNVYYNDELEKITLNIENAEYFLGIEKQIRQDALADMHAQLIQTPAAEADLYKLRIEKAKIEYEYYVYDAELRIEKWKTEKAEIEEKLRGVRIIAPVDGIAGSVAVLQPGGAVEPGTAIVYLYYSDAFRLNINADASNFRYNMDVEIEIANDSVYPGRIISDPRAVYPDGGNLDFKVAFDAQQEMTDALAAVLNNRRISVTGKITDLTGVPILPYHSIYNENGSRYVFLLEDNIVKKRYIQIGLFNFQTAEIISGIKPGERILE